MTTDNTQDVLRDVFEAGRDQDPEARLQILGRELVNRLFMLYRTGKVHDLSNQAVTAAIEALGKVLEAITEISDTVAIMAIGEGFYLNRVLLKVEFSSFENFRYLSELLRKYQVAGFRFIGKPPPAEVRTLLEEMLRSSTDPSAPGWLGNLKLPQITIISGSELSESERRTITPETLTDPHYLLRLYTKTLLSLKAFLGELEKGEFASISRLQRCIHEFVDATSEESTNLLSLASIRSSGDYLAHHSVNCALLTLLVGRELGLTKHRLSDLGTSALLHDIGKVQIPREILEKKIPLSDAEWDVLKKGNTLSLMQLIRLKGFNESALRRMLVAYEHTLEYGVEGTRQPTILSRIVALAHCYDAMTTSQSYRDAMLPHEALKLMAQEEGKKFDPVLFRIFVKVVTSYPNGTLVLLDSKEIGVVVHTTGPRIRLIYDSAGRKLATGKVVEAKIVKALDASKYGVNTLVFLLPQPTPTN